MNIEQKILCLKIQYCFCLKSPYPSKYKGNHKFHMKFKLKFFLVFRVDVCKSFPKWCFPKGLSKRAFHHAQYISNIESTGRLYTWNWKYCNSSSCCKAIIISARPFEQNILYLKIQYHFCLNRQCPSQ